MCGECYATTDQLMLLLGDEEAETAEMAVFMARAQEDVDTLTLHRIPAKGGLDALTPAQRERVSSVTAQLAAWKYQYSEAVEHPFSSYGINGVSMSMEPRNVATVGGVTLPKRLYSMLCETGLCYRGYRGL